MTKLGKMTVATLAVTSLLAQGTVAMAAPPGSVRDLVGARAAGGESTLEERGFNMHHGLTKDGGKITYWWNPTPKNASRLILMMASSTQST